MAARDTPPASSPEVRRRMQSTPQSDTPAERALRSALHILGLRFRVNTRIRGVPRRTIDIAFHHARLAVFVDGCFWHGCPKHGTLPKSNRRWWKAKIDTNRRRDDDTNRQLRAVGWLPVRIWEHQDVVIAAKRIAVLVRSRSAKM